MQSQSERTLTIAEAGMIEYEPGEVFATETSVKTFPKTFLAQKRRFRIKFVFHPSPTPILRQPSGFYPARECVGRTNSYMQVEK